MEGLLIQSTQNWSSIIGVLAFGLGQVAGAPAQPRGLLDFALDTSAEALAASKKAELSCRPPPSTLTLTLTLSWTTAT